MIFFFSRTLSLTWTESEVTLMERLELKLSFSRWWKSSLAWERPYSKSVFSKVHFKIFSDSWKMDPSVRSA